jgi:hypothetical protein
VKAESAAFSRQRAECEGTQGAHGRRLI